MPRTLQEEKNLVTSFFPFPTTTRRRCLRWRKWKISHRKFSRKCSIIYFYSASNSRNVTSISRSRLHLRKSLVGERTDHSTSSSIQVATKWVYLPDSYLAQFGVVGSLYFFFSPIDDDDDDAPFIGENSATITATEQQQEQQHVNLVVDTLCPFTLPHLRGRSGTGTVPWPLFWSRTTNSQIPVTSGERS